ncbi:Protein arginine N-methyltransferase 1 [Bienertia sinuspersici]
MTKDEWKEKSVIKKKETNSSSSHSTTVDYAVPSTKGEKIVAL